MGLLGGLAWMRGPRSYELYWRERGEDRFLVLEAPDDDTARLLAFQSCKHPLLLREIRVRDVPLGLPMRETAGSSRAARHRAGHDGSAPPPPQ